jgi:hypothetical protein
MPSRNVQHYPARPCGYCGAPYRERPRVHTCSRKCGARLRADGNPQVPSGAHWPSETEVARSEDRRRAALRTELGSGATREIPLHGIKAAGRVAFVDAADYDLVAQYRWWVWEGIGQRGRFGPYAQAKIGSGRGAPKKLMHQLLTGNPRTDHVNHDGLDNRRVNLRVATATQNLGNQRPVRGGSSPFKGVYLRRDTGRWKAQIKVSGRWMSLGCHDTDADAARAYDIAAREAFGEFACLNFPEEVA